jgi:hypothetical protein
LNFFLSKGISDVQNIDERDYLKASYNRAIHQAPFTTPADLPEYFWNFLHHEGFLSTLINLINLHNQETDSSLLSPLALECLLYLMNSRGGLHFLISSKSEVASSSLNELLSTLKKSSNLQNNGQQTLKESLKSIKENGTCDLRSIGNILEQHLQALTRLDMANSILQTKSPLKGSQGTCS